MGKLIPFHRPEPKLPPKKKDPDPTDTKKEWDQQLNEEGLLIPAKIVLEEATKVADEFDEVMIIIQDFDGSVGVLTNLETFAERLAIIERIKAQLIREDVMMSDLPTMDDGA